MLMAYFQIYSDQPHERCVPGIRTVSIAVGDFNNDSCLDIVARLLQARGVWVFSSDIAMVLSPSPINYPINGELLRNSSRW